VQDVLRAGAATSPGGRIALVGALGLAARTVTGCGGGQPSAGASADPASGSATPASATPAAATSESATTGGESSGVAVEYKLPKG